MKSFFLAGIILCSTLLASDCQQSDSQYSNLYLKLGTGPSISRKATIYTNPALWDPAEEGYNASLGTVPIVLGGLGYDNPYICTDITLTYRPDYSYSKYQIPTTGTTPGALGTTTRRFNLDIGSAMWTVYLSGRGWVKSWPVYPIIGGGVGVSRLLIYNFRSTGLPTVVDGEPSFASENQYTVNYRFTYQVMAGFEYRFKDICALSLGYRWFDPNRFSGPRYLRDNEGNALDVGSNTWKINFSANEVFAEFKVFFGPL